MTRQKIEGWIVAVFAPKPKETLTEVAEKIAKFIGTHPPKERVLILQNIEKRALADLITERKEAENKQSDCISAINKLSKSKIL